MSVLVLVGRTKDLIDIDLWGSSTAWRRMLLRVVFQSQALRMSAVFVATVAQRHAFLFNAALLAMHMNKGEDCRSLVSSLEKVSVVTAAVSSCLPKYPVIWEQHAPADRLWASVVAARHYSSSSKW